MDSDEDTDSEKWRTLECHWNMTLAEVRKLRCPLCGGQLTFHYIPRERDALWEICHGCGRQVHSYRLSRPPAWAAESPSVTTVAYEPILAAESAGRADSSKLTEDSAKDWVLETMELLRPVTLRESREGITYVRKYLWVEISPYLSAGAELWQWKRLPNYGLAAVKNGVVLKYWTTTHVCNKGSESTTP